MNNPIISVIVPAYNVAEYLERCVDSLIRQKTSIAYEVLIIDDGSIDGTYDKALDIQKRATDKIRVFHKQNGGLSSARNYGLDRVSSSSEYVSFVDSDDYVADSFIDLLYSLIKDNHADISMCLANRVQGSDGVGPVFSSGFKNDFVTQDIDWVLCNSSFSACNKLFKLNLFFNLRFPEGITYEDFALIPRIINNAFRVCYTHTILYHYFINPSSITLSIKQTDTNIFVAQQILEQSELKEKPYILEVLFLRRVILSMAWTMLCKDNNIEGAKRIRHYQKQFYPNLSKNKHLKELPLYDRFFVWLFCNTNIKCSYLFLKIIYGIKTVMKGASLS